MDSKVVNKLIRSQAWPLLRRQGFSKFDSRNAWRYCGPLVDVVNFQSFNSSLASSLDCTTYSFALNIGAYLRRCSFERQIKKDAAGAPRPQEYECSFRAQLKKRTPVDGFDRADIFYIDPKGITMDAVFAEVLLALEVQALPWFGALSDLGALVRMLSEGGPVPSGTESLGMWGFDPKGSNGELVASLQLERHSQSPDAVSANSCLEAIDVAAGAVLDSFYPITGTPIAIEAGSYRIRDLLVRIQDSLAMPEDHFLVLPLQCQLLGENWSIERKTDAASASISAASKRQVSARESFWPQLRKLGFVDFTDRLAHRPSEDSIEVVSFVPMDRRETRAHGYPPGLFRIGLGVFWPALAKPGKIRKNRREEFRPTLDECQLQMWLMPAEREIAAGQTCFNSVESASSALQNDAQRWFALCRDKVKLTWSLEEPDWVILARNPTMRGHGSVRSLARALLRVLLSDRDDLRSAQFKAAYEALNHHPESQRPYLHRWVENVEAAFETKT